MTTLYLLRHAHAGDPEKWNGDDDLRPLSAKGRRQAERLGTLLAGWSEAPDLFVTSPRARADETARLAAAALGAGVVVDDRLAGPLDADIVDDIVAANGDAERACLVGHDPDFSSLLGELTGTAEIPMRKGAIARIDFPGAIRNGRGTIRLLLPPEAIAAR
jgi:phosphohistidine phosphatase SixA